MVYQDMVDSMQYEYSYLPSRLCCLRINSNYFKFSSFFLVIIGPPFRAVKAVVRRGSPVVPQGSSKDLLNGLHELPIRYMSLSGSDLKRWFMSILSWRASGLGGIQIMVIVVETDRVVLDYDMNLTICMLSHYNCQKFWAVMLFLPSSHTIYALSYSLYNASCTFYCN